MSLRRRLSSLLMMPALLSACGAGGKLAVVDRATQLAHPDVPTVDVEEARRLVEDGAIWVDVRSPEERSVSRIPGAIDGEVVVASPEDFEGKVLVAYCTIGVRSAAWAEKRREDGLDARNLAGSVMAWARDGGDFVAPDGSETTRVHTWSDRFDWLPDGYEGVSQPAVPKDGSLT